MVGTIIKGGPVMIPLLLCSIVAVAVMLERLWYLYKTRADSETLLDDVKETLHQGKLLEAMRIAKRAKGPVASIVAAAIANHDRDKEELRERIEDAGREELFKLERRLGILDSIVTIAPLLGLLGTVTGIINSFHILAALDGVAEPSALSSGIAQALITTAAGLIIAIPTLIAYNWISSLIEQRVREMNRRANELMDLVVDPEDEPGIVLNRHDSRVIS